MALSCLGLSSSCPSAPLRANAARKVVTAALGTSVYLACSGCGGGGCYPVTPLAPGAVLVGVRKGGGR